jgi:hypothetical protein
VNVEYYQSKLMDLVKKFQGFLPPMIPGGLPLKERSEEKGED